MAAAASTAVPSPLPRAGGLFPAPLWTHPPTAFPVPPAAQLRPPGFPLQAAPMPPPPLGLGGTAGGWLPPSAAGLVPPPPAALLVPYPIPVPLPLPLPIPIPVPIVGKSAAAADGSVSSPTTTEAAAETRDGEGADGRDGSPGPPRESGGDAASPPESGPATSADPGNALDLTTGGGRGQAAAESSATGGGWTAAARSTLDSSPYLSRRSLILDAPPAAVDRKCFGEQRAGNVRAPSLTAVNKRFNHHRRRTTTQTPLVKSK